MSEAIETQDQELSLRNIRVSMDHADLRDLPAIYANFAEVRPGYEEVIILLGVRDDFNASEVDGDVTVTAYPVAKIMLGPSVALQLAGILKSQADLMVKAIEGPKAKKAAK